MKEYILITGASSGIGYAMAKQLAAKGFNLILVARRKDRLEALRLELKQVHQVTVEVFIADLSKEANVFALYEEVSQRGLTVSMLVNNAGFGEYGDFLSQPLQQEIEMIQVNITAVVMLTKLFLKDMKKAGRGTVMNIASLLSYLPFPYYSVYSATKAFVLAFTETLAAEFAGTNISIKALCPGPVDTEFNTPKMLATNAYKANKPIAAAKVAEAGVKHLLRGNGSKKVGFNNWFISNLPRITPDFLMMKIKLYLASPVGKPL